MKRLGCIISLAAIIGCAQAPELGAQERARRPPNEAAYQTIELSGPYRAPLQNLGPWIAVPGVTVNGTGPHLFLLDTGASGGGRIDASLAEALGLRPTGEVAVRGAGGGQTSGGMPLFTLSALTFGSLTAHDLEVASRDYNDAQSLAMRRGQAIQGILGMGLFQDLLLTIDYPNSELRIERGALPAADGRGVLNLIQEGATLAVEATVAGHTAIARLDTGSPASITIGGEFADRLSWRAPPRVVGQGRTAAGAFDIERATLEGEFRLGAVTIANPEVDIVRSFEGVTVGSRILREFAITIDQRSGRLRLSRGSSTATQDSTSASSRTEVRQVEGNPSGRRYGIALAPPQGGEQFLTVLDVLPGEVAAASGLQSGDRILRINGRPVAEIAPQELGSLMRAERLQLVVERGGQSLVIEMSLQ